MKVQAIIKTHARTGLLLCLASFICIVFAQDDGNEIKQLVRQASKKCREAKTLRRSDLAAAQEHFRTYQQLFSQVLQNRPDFLDSPDKETNRVMEFCQIVKKDLDRAEALPQFEKGLRECAEARVMMENNAFEDAQAQFKRYKEYRDGAIAISESVLDIYDPNSYEVSLCDRLGNDIAQARSEYQKQIAAAKSKDDAFNEVIAALKQSERQCQGAQNLISDTDEYSPQTVSQVESLSKEAAEDSKLALSLRDKLLAQGKRLDSKAKEEIDRQAAVISQCQSGLPKGIAQIKAVLLARANKQGGADKGRSEIVNRDLRQIVGAPAQYPKKAIRKGVEGHVIVSFTVTKNGDVADLNIKEAEPDGYFEQTVLAAVAKYKFQPRVKNNRPVDSKGIERKIVFKLK